MRGLVVSRTFSRFVEDDVRILAQRYEVARFFWRDRRDTFRLMKEVARHDFVYCWFATDHAAVAGMAARLTRTPIIVVAGGYDVANEPSIGYGRAAGRRLERWLTALALRWADVVLTVSPLNDEETAAWGRHDRRFLVPPGVDTGVFKPLGPTVLNTRPIVLTLSSTRKGGLPRKGVLDFVRAAGLVPEADFIHVGEVASDDLHAVTAEAGRNVQFLGRIEDRELMSLMNRSAVICQPSYHESFCLSLAEGMACGAVPVASESRIGVAPYLGDALITSRYGDAGALAGAIRDALERAREDGVRLQMHSIVDSGLSLRRRGDALHAVLAPFLAGGRRSRRRPA